MATARAELDVRPDGNEPAGLRVSPSQVVRQVADRHWRLRKFSDAEELGAFAAIARRDLDIREFQQDVEWLNAQRGEGGDELIVLADGADTISGLLAARFAPTMFEYSLNDTVLFRMRVPQYTVHEGPLTTRTPARNELEQGLHALHAVMQRDALVYFSSVPSDGEFDKLLCDAQSSIRTKFYVLPWGCENFHFRIRWKGDVAAYLESLSAKKRGNVKRASQKIKAVSPYTVRKFERPEDIDAFLKDGVTISDKTYQSQEFGMGLISAAGREALIRFAAARNAFCGYVMYLKEVPIAFRYGFVYGQTLFAIATGFDPDWSSVSPGAVLFLDMLGDLAAAHLAITKIDLLPHVTPFKSDRANDVSGTRNYYLIRRSAKGFALYASVTVLEQAKLAAQGLWKAAAKFRSQWMKAVAGRAGK